MTFKSLEEWCLHLSGLDSPGESSVDDPAVTSVGRLLQSVSRPAMGCEFEVLLNAQQYPQGVEFAVEALAVVEQIEGLFSVYRPQSQISKVNQFAFQRPVLVDAMTLELVQLSVDVHEWTKGAFDITAGSLSEAWGFARRQGSMPSEEAIEASLSTVGCSYIQLDLNQSTISFTRPGILLNSGGIGKGYALDCSARFLQRSGIDDFLIHGGLSSVVARGRRSGLEGKCWNIAIKHPWRTDEILEIVPLENQALGTSGSGKQFFHFGGKRYSHLIDPRTGWPADQAMSITVICPSGGVADALATGLFILGPAGAAEFCEAHPEVKALVVFTHPKTGLQCVERRNWEKG